MDQIVGIMDSVLSNDVTYRLVCVSCAVIVLAILVRLLVILTRTHTTLEGIKRGVEDASEQEREALDNLQKSVSGEGESSLLSQIQRLRTDFAAHRDSQNELLEEFRQFAETMAENNSKALFESLANVIQGSNAQLNEQHRVVLMHRFVETLRARSRAIPGSDVSEKAMEKPIPPVPAPPELDSEVGLDAKLVASVIADTEHVSSVLGDIFHGEEPEDNQEETLEDAGDAFFSGLDTQHAAFLGKLLMQAHWKEAELETLAKQFQLMWEGALETVNDWSFQRFDDPLLIEEHEGYGLNPDVTAQLQE